MAKLFDQYGRPIQVAEIGWTFGVPQLRAGGKGKASWSKERWVRQGAWTAKLDGGPQSNWDDFASYVIPVNELSLTELQEVQYMYYLSVAVGLYMGTTIYCHDPEDHEKRIEISHTPTTNEAAGWKENIFNVDQGGCFWYGENCDEAGLLREDAGAGGNIYTFAQFKQDALFKNFTIYKIQLDYGYYTGDVVMNGCYLANCQINNEVIPIQPSIMEQIDLVRDEMAGAVKSIPAWKFGTPQLRADNNGFARWDRAQLNAKGNWGTDGNRQFRHGPWAVHLNGGEQTGGEDWASVWIPVNDVPLIDFFEFMWNYYKFVDGTPDVGAAPPNIVIATRNPDDHDERAEISQTASAAGAVTEGWHETILLPSTAAALFWYGNNVDSDLVEGTNYTLAQFLADKAFSHHVVYLIKLDYGFWGGARTTGDAWIGTIQINNENIVLEPPIAEQLDMSPIIALHASGAEVATVTGEEVDISLIKAANFYLDVTANAGDPATQTLDVTIEEKDPVSGEWFEILAFAQKTTLNVSERKSYGTGAGELMLGNPIRYVATIAGGGATVSYTFSLSMVGKT